jgi:hypothetical protein
MSLRARSTADAVDDPSPGTWLRRDLAAGLDGVAVSVFVVIGPSSK